MTLNTVSNSSFLILTVLFRESSFSANSWSTGKFLCTDFLVLIQRKYIDLLSYSVVHCHIIANVQFCKICVSVIDNVQRHMHIFTRSKCHRQAIFSQVLLSHWFQLSIQLNSLSFIYQFNVFPKPFQLSRPLCLHVVYNKLHARWKVQEDVPGLTYPREAFSTHHFTSSFPLAAKKI